jgi:hypothetical protein
MKNSQNIPEEAQKEQGPLARDNAIPGGSPKNILIIRKR